jgi:GT2 family glycosyltransferase/SAM-dependent methyltransferase/glycosyltransferase involved in cell wall biosynthesis
VIARRRAGAPRLIGWTGERCVPWAPDVQVVYEHLHRYLWASQIVGGRRVLDLGSGEGYGSAILAETAAHVIGLDVDDRAIEHSRLNYVGEGNLGFRVGSATDLSEFADGSFDAVVAFEVIEHVRDHDRMVAELGRVLVADGVLILSTPERRTYSELPGYENPFHVRELTLEELRALLGREFANTAVWAQHVVTGSVMAAIDPAVPSSDGSASSQFFVERSGDEWSRASAPIPVYVVAVASNGRLPESATSSMLADCGLALMRETETEAAGASAAAEALQAQLESARAGAENAHRAHEAQLDGARADLENARTGYEVQLESARAELVGVRESYEAQLESERAELANVRERYEAQLESDRAELVEVREGYEAQLESDRAELVEVREGYEAQLESERAELVEVRERYEAQLESDRVELVDVREGYEAQLESGRVALGEAGAKEQELRAAFERQRAALEAAECRARDAEATLDAEIPRLQAQIATERSVGEELRTQLLAVGDENGELRAELLALGDRLSAAEKVVRRIDESVAWRAFQRLRAGLYRILGGDRSRPGRTFGAAMRSLGRLPLLRPKPSLATPQGGFPLHGEPAATSEAREPDEALLLAASPEIELPVFAEPSVSLIVPLYACAELTRECLESIRDNTAGVTYEVILVDDTADQETKQLLALVRGATIVVNDQNLGYLRSVNRGATLARGRWLALCNNDIQVQPGWLRAMKACAESQPDIGAVTPKYIYPEGRLAEAGGIIWRDGTGVNYGRGDNPQEPAYNYRREVDYGSAAALLVRADLFSRRGGYDERYSPMYYEDADLCFQLREEGMRVVYEPEALVVHVEGGTAGTDPTTGYKRHQEENRLRFVSKWSRTLGSVHLTPRTEDRRRAADRFATGHVLVIDHVVPMWNRDAGSLRMLGMIHSLQKLGFQVLFIPDNFAPVQPYVKLLQRMGVEVLHSPFDVYGEFQTCAPLLNGVLLSRPTVAPRWLTMVRDLAPDATVIYDTVDLHWIREGRRMAVSGTNTVTAAKVSALRELELAMVRAADVTLVVTDVERQTLEAEVADAQIRVVPMLHEIADNVPPAADRSGIIFLGGFAHPPNTDAAMHLVESIMPLVWRTLPDVAVTIVGGDPPPEVLALEQVRVKVTGWVEDVDALLHASRVMVAPLRFGAGMKGKITLSLALGLPVVTTAVGAEGLETGEAGGLIVADDPTGLADGIVELCTDDELWQQLSGCGQAAMARTCAPSIAYDVFRLLLTDTPDEKDTGDERTHVAV